MKLFSKAKDGGRESNVDGYFLFEFKGLFSVALLRFNKGCREAYHSHAFNAYTWFLFGDMIEQDISGATLEYKQALKPKYTPRQKVHRVLANRNSWALTIRGKWADQWFEMIDGKKVILAHGRKVVGGVDE